MPIEYKDGGMFHLFNNEISYIIGLLPNQQPGHIYFGTRLHSRNDYSYLQPHRARPLMAYVNQDDNTFSLQHSRHEFPAYGSTDFHYPAFEIEQANGSRICNFVYRSHEIYPGKRHLAGLPATYVEDDNEAASLDISLYDQLLDVELILTYTIYSLRPVITRSSRFINHGQNAVILHRAMSMCLDFPDCDYEMIQLDGAWSRERHINRFPIHTGVQSIHSMRGPSSAEHNPFVVFARENTNESGGEAIGISLVYSGNFLAQMEVDTFGSGRFIMGIHPHTFEWKLIYGETFQTPEAVIAYSADGLGGLSRTYHDLYNSRLVRGYWRERERPLLANNWEATGFDFDEERILRIAAAAAEIGVELFVLDDGWFGSRNNDEAGLGDWHVNYDKLPDGIDGLASRVESLGIKFGIWIEPEMVNEDSDLYRAHPDWIIHTPGRSKSKSRNQFVLDYSRVEVVEHIYQQISRLLSDAHISYVKWDMNRYITECYSQALPPDEQGKVFHKHILGVYSLYEKLINQFPHVLFESCSSGGARFDPGMLHYAPQTWTSDNTDAIERIYVQYGTSLAYPVSSMGAHVSDVPNQQVGRIAPINTRFHVAMFGAFGYEFDLSAMAQDEIKILKHQCEFFKRYRKVLQYGDFYRLISPFETQNRMAAWMTVSKTKEEAILCVYRILNQANRGWKYIHPKGIDHELSYEVYVSRPGSDKLIGSFHASQLASAGIPVHDEYFEENELSGDFSSCCFILRAIF